MSILARYLAGDGSDWLITTKAAVTQGDMAGRVARSVLNSSPHKLSWVPAAEVTTTPTEAPHWDDGGWSWDDMPGGRRRDLEQAVSPVQREHAQTFVRAFDHLLGIL